MMIDFRAERQRECKRQIRASIAFNAARTGLAAAEEADPEMLVFTAEDAEALNEAIAAAYT